MSRKTRLKINDQEYKNLKEVENYLFDLGKEQGYLVFSTQWAKNPLSATFLAPVYAREDGNLTSGIVRVRVYTDNEVHVSILGLGKFDKEFKMESSTS